MPKIFEYLGISILFYSNEHEPIHVHGKYQGCESKAEFIIVDGKISQILIKNVKGKQALPSNELKEFQEFYRENAESWIDRFYYKEAGQQLLLMAFLQRVINGGGSIDREMAVGSGRTDLLITFCNEQFLLELKIKHFSSTREKGLKQIVRYMDTLDLQHAWLILFEKQKSDIVTWEQRINWEEIKFNGKNITIVEM